MNEDDKLNPKNHIQLLNKTIDLVLKESDIAFTLDEDPSISKEDKDIVFQNAGDSIDNIMKAYDRIKKNLED